jgi:hypothetical protein
MEDMDCCTANKFSYAEQGQKLTTAGAVSGHPVVARGTKAQPRDIGHCRRFCPTDIELDSHRFAAFKSTGTSNPARSSWSGNPRNAAA